MRLCLICLFIYFKTHIVSQSVMSHFTIPQTRPEFPGKADIWSASPGGLQNLTKEDQEYVWSTAVNIKKYIDEMITQKTQPATFIQHFPDKKNKRKERDDSKTDSAREWKKFNMIALQIYFVPVEEFSHVVPAAFVPSDQETISRFGRLCDPKITREVLLDAKKIGEVVPEPEQVALRCLLLKVRKLLAIPPARSEEHQRSKGEVYSDALLRRFLEYLGVDDITVTNLVLKYVNQ